MLSAVMLAGCEPTKTELRNSAIGEYQVGNFSQSKEVFEQLLTEYPSDAVSLFYMGRIHHEEGFYEKAVYYYQCCLDANPRYTAARSYLEEAKQAAGQAGEQLQFIP